MRKITAATPHQNLEKQSGFSAEQWRAGVAQKPYRDVRIRDPLLGDYATKEEMARELNMAVRTLDRLHALGRGPAGRTKLSGRVYYNRQKVASWLESLEQG